MATFTYTGPTAPNDDAAEIPDMSNKKIFMGFLQNWGPGPGYQGGTSSALELKDIPPEYNVVAVAFMTGTGIPTFKPYNVTDAEFRRQVGELNKQGRAVIVSLGGANAPIKLYKGDEPALATEIIRLVEVYGFDGLDIDLEQAAIDDADNNTVIPEALKLVRQHYAQQGKHFIITMAPEFPHLRTGGKYVPYLVALANYFDWISPQYYNQVGDGLSVPALNPSWLAQNDGKRKKEFLYYLTTALATGTYGFVKIPANQLLIGLPSNRDAADNGDVVDPGFVQWALDQLKADSNEIRGLMTWSLNWESGTNQNGAAYNWIFKRHYSPMIQ